MLICMLEPSAQAKPLQLFIADMAPLCNFNLLYFFLSFFLSFFFRRFESFRFRQDLPRFHRRCTALSRKRDTVKPIYYFWSRCRVLSILEIHYSFMEIVWYHSAMMNRVLARFQELDYRIRQVHYQKSWLFSFHIFWQCFDDSSEIHGSEKFLVILIINHLQRGGYPNDIRKHGKWMLHKNTDKKESGRMKRKNPSHCYIRGGYLIISQLIEFPRNWGGTMASLQPFSTPVNSIHRLNIESIIPLQVQ